MIQYLSDLIKSSLSEKIVQLGFSDVFVEALVRSGLILLVLLTCWIIHQIVQGPLMRSFERFSRFTNQHWDNALIEKHFTTFALLHSIDNFIYTYPSNIGRNCCSYTQHCFGKYTIINCWNDDS